MPVRDLVVLSLVLVCSIIAIVRPWIGVCGFGWVSYMNPHRLTWSVAYGYPVALMIAGCTLGGIVLGRDRIRIPREREAVILAALWAMFTISPFFALYPEDAWKEWTRISKILLMTFVTIGLIYDRKRLDAFAKVIVWSMGFLVVKGALFGVASGGAYKVFGPPESFLEDNNDFAHAVCMALPLMIWASAQSPAGMWKNIYRVMVPSAVLSVLLTYSRGGLLSLVAVLSVYWLRSRRKAVVAIALLVGVAVAGPFLPQAWYDRMGTIAEYDQDASTLGRFNAWHVAWNVALERPFTGGGPGMFRPEVFQKYAPDPEDFHDVHSIYFEMVGEQGFLAFSLFALMIASTMLSLYKLKLEFRFFGDEWASGLCDAIFSGLIAYLVGGAFLGRAYFDLMYHLVAMAVILKAISAVQYNATQTGPAPIRPFPKLSG